MVMYMVKFYKINIKVNSTGIILELIGRFHDHKQNITLKCFAQRCVVLHYFTEKSCIPFSKSLPPVSSRTACSTVEFINVTRGVHLKLNTLILGLESLILFPLFFY